MFKILWQTTKQSLAQCIIYFQIYIFYVKPSPVISHISVLSRKEIAKSVQQVKALLYCFDLFATESYHEMRQKIDNIDH